MELILESTESHTDYDDGRSLQRIIMKDKMIMIWFSWHDCLGAKDLGGEDASCFIWEMMTKHKRTEEGGLRREDWGERTEEGVWVQRWEWERSSNASFLPSIFTNETLGYFKTALIRVIISIQSWVQLIFQSKV